MYDAENGRRKIKQDTVDVRGRRCRQNCRHRSIISQKKTSHELCKKEKNSGKLSLYGTLTAVIRGNVRQDMSQYGRYPADGLIPKHCGIMIPRSRLPRQRQAHLPCQERDEEHCTSCNRPVGVMGTCSDIDCHKYV